MHILVDVMKLPESDAQRVFNEFASQRAAAFYNLEQSSNDMEVVRGKNVVADGLPLESGEQVVLFMAGQDLGWLIAE